MHPSTLFCASRKTTPVLFPLLRIFRTSNYPCNFSCSEQQTTAKTRFVWWHWIAIKTAVICTLHRHTFLISATEILSQKVTWYIIVQQHAINTLYSLPRDGLVITAVVPSQITTTVPMVHASRGIHIWDSFSLSERSCREQDSQRLPILYNVPRLHSQQLQIMGIIQHIRRSYLSWNYSRSSLISIAWPFCYLLL